MKDVQITVSDKQIYATHEDTNQSKFWGQVTNKGDVVYITYKDPKMQVTTLIKIKKEVVSVKRLGNLRGNLEFNPKKPHETIYYTPYGEMQITIVTKKCDIHLSNKEINLCIEYKILMQNKEISDNIYSISIKG